MAKKEDLKGRTPEEILEVYEYRYVIPYDDNLDIVLCALGGRTKELAEIEKYKDDKMELLRRRDPVNWAARLIKSRRNRSEMQQQGEENGEEGK